jgi:uncharacterized membrane protein YebE (DUF533 family)
MALDQLFGALSNGSSDPRSLLGGLLGSSGAQGALGGAASGAVVSLLMNPKARKKIGKHAVKVGGVAALAGVGYLAYRQWQQGRQPRPGVPTATNVPPPVPIDLESASVEVNVSTELPMKMVLAMIAAAAADGTIDGTEMNALLGAIEQAPIEADEKSRLTAALNAPPTVEDVAALATGPEEASELYGAALTTIEIDTPAEDFFMRRLALALKLEPELVENLHRTLEGE